MKRDINIEKRNTEAKKVYARIMKKRAPIAAYDMKPKNGVIPDISDIRHEECEKCSKGKVHLKVEDNHDWEFTLEKATVVNAGGHSLVFICGECGARITKRSIDNCKTKHPKYTP